MRIEEALETADALGLRLSNLCQYSYLLGSARHHNHWACTFRTDKGGLHKGCGRTPLEAVLASLASFGAKTCGVEKKVDLGFLD